MSEILIISLDTPYPDNYGGAKDIWQRMGVLKENGHKLHLLAFYKDPIRRKIFEDNIEAHSIFESTILFPTKGLKSLFSFYPFSVASRRLNSDQVSQIKHQFECLRFDAVEVEGLQSLLTFTSLLSSINFDRVYVRAFNRESAYQYNLARNEGLSLLKVAFYFDSAKFWFFERFGTWKKIVEGILFISKDEMGHRNFLGVRRQHLIPPISSGIEVTKMEEDFLDRENLFLYVGNLKLPDNQAAVRAAFRDLRPILERNKWCFAICGLSHDTSILPDIQAHPLVSCKFNLSTAELAAFYKKAKIFVCFSENQSGVKLKLIEALKMGVPVVANQEAVKGSQLEKAVLMFDTKDVKLEEKLTDIMSNSQNWQRQRLHGYTMWYLLNSESRANYLELFV